MTGRIDKLITPERLRLYPIVFIVASVFGVTASSLARIIDPTILGAFMPDFLAHWTGGGLLISGDTSNLYDPETQQSFQKRAIGADVPLSWFVSPPIVAAFYAPLAIFQYNISGLLWLILSTALLVWSALSLKMLAPRLMLRKRSVVVLAVLASPPVFELLGGGQDSAFILAVWLIGIRLLSSQHSFWAGAVLGLGCAKPQLVVLVPLVLLATKNFRALASFVVVSAVLVGISVGLVGVGGIYQWIAALSSPLYMEQVQHGQAWKMVSLPSLVQALFPPAWASWLAPILTWSPLPIGAGIILFSIYRVRARRLDTPAVWIATLATTATFSPHLASYDAVLFIPVIIFLLEQRSSQLIRVSSVAAFGLLWLAPVLHVAADSFPWPLTVIDAPWSAIPLAAIWFESLKALRPQGNQDRQMREGTADFVEIQSAAETQPRHDVPPGSNL